MTLAGEYDRCDWHLANWAQWMRDYQPKLYFQSRAQVIGISFSRDFDEMVSATDQRCAAAVDAIVEDLLPLQRSAVHHVQLGSAWRFAYEVALFYSAAKACVTLGLTRRCIW